MAAAAFFGAVRASCFDQTGLGRSGWACNRGWATAQARPSCRRLPTRAPPLPRPAPPPPAPRRTSAIVSPTVIQEARAQFGCDKIPGAFLENEGGQGSANAHWEYRWFQGELMVATNLFAVYGKPATMSRITLAFLQDTGWCAAEERATAGWGEVPLGVHGVGSRRLWGRAGGSRCLMCPALIALASTALQSVRARLQSWLPPDWGPRRAAVNSRPSHRHPIVTPSSPHLARYDVNWDAAGFLDWGYQAGCGFVLETCEAYIKSNPSQTYFCTRDDYAMTTNSVCTFNGLARAKCEDAQFSDGCVMKVRVLLCIWMCVLMAGVIRNPALAPPTSRGGGLLLGGR
jgi:hypothetical protein